MLKRLTRTGMAGLALVLIGLAMGLWPRHIDTADFTDVSCGTPFFPASSPSGELRDPWGDIFGYSPADRGRAILGTLCWDSVDEESYAGMALVAAGGLLVAGAWWVSRSNNPTDAGREAYWRQRGWAPREEVHGPPAGWQRREDAGVPRPVDSSQNRQYPPAL